MRKRIGIFLLAASCLAGSLHLETLGAPAGAVWQQRQEEAEGTPGGNEGNEGTPGGSEGSEGTPGGNEGSEGTPGGNEGSEGTPGGNEGSEGTPGGSEGSEGTPGGSEGSEGTPGGSEGSEGTPGGSEGGEEPPAETCTLTFQMEKGHFPDGSTSVTVTVAKGQFPDASAVETPVREGYLFQNWLDGDNMPYGFDVPVTGDLTLTASWEAISYYVHFDANGGTGSMEDELFVYAKSKALTKNGFKREGYTFVGWNTQKDGSGAAYENKQKVKSLSAQADDVVTLYAIWQGNSYTVRYDGNGAASGSVPDSSHVYGIGSNLSNNQYAKKGCTFAGWNTQADGKGKTYKAGAEVTGLTTESGGVVVLYAKWTAIKYTIAYNPGKGKMGASARKTYTVETKTFVLPRPTRSGYDFDGWYKKKNYKSRIGEVAQGSTGNLTLYAKWVKCSGKAKSNSAKLTACKATGAGKVSVKAKISKRVASSDDYYYLMYLNPMNQKTYKVADKAYKKKSISFALKTQGNQGTVTSMYGIAVKKSGKYTLISTASYVKNPEKAAGNKKKYNPGQTKKGMQFYNSMAEIDDCGAKQNFLNVTVSQVCNGGTVPYAYNGNTYYFSDLGAYKQIVSECNKKNITVTMQVLLDWTEHTDLIHPSARVQGAAPFYTWNVFSNPAREKMEAIFCYLGAVFGQKDCYVSNWVLGNEINNPGDWNYAGSMSKTNYFKTYAYAFRALYYAVRSQYSNARVFICTDNCWNILSGRRFTAKESIAAFVAQLKKVQSGLKWNLAYHAYSYPLTYTKVWEGYGVTDDVSTPAITMKNLKVLTDYMKKTYGKSVRIILSEQGYSSYAYGQTAQAAALAYSYYIAACNPMVDAFIIRSYWDHPDEVKQGLSMGIKGKEAFDVYKYMDTAKSSSYTKKYLKTIGISSWKKAVPGYQASRVKKMYRKE